MYEYTFCYKVVYREIDGRLLSATANSLPTGWAVEYALEQPVRAYIGKLFAFRTIDQAHQFVANHGKNIPLAIYKAQAANAHPVDTVLSLASWEEEFEEFWYAHPNPYDRDLYFMPTPVGTIAADTITLIERVA